MRIFVVLSRIPYPLEKGDKLRAFHQIKELSKNNEIILFALNDRKVNEQEAFQFLQPFCRSVNFFHLTVFCRIINLALSLFSGKPFQVGYFYSCKAKRQIKKLIEEYQPDHLYFQLARMAEYSKGLNLPKTLDYQDAFSKGLLRRVKYTPFLKKFIFWIEYKRMLDYEHKIFDYFNHKTIISIPDREAILHSEKQKIHIVSNGVDFDFYKPQEQPKEFDLIFSGNMSYPPNILGVRYLIRNVLPILQERGVNIKMVFAGASPVSAIKSMASENIIVTGWVKDLRVYYARSKIFVAPMQIGTGLQNKLLEAMSMEIPCITTPLTNHALKAINNIDLLIAKKAEEFADHIEFLLRNPKKAEEIGKNGRIFVKQNFSWGKAVQELENILQS